MEPKEFIVSMLDLIHDLAIATHAGEQIVVAQRADALKEKIDTVFPQDSRNPAE